MGSVPEQEEGGRVGLVVLKGTDKWSEVKDVFITRDKPRDEGNT